MCRHGVNGVCRRGAGANAVQETDVTGRGETCGDGGKNLCETGDKSGHSESHLQQTPGRGKRDA